jgi:NDP-sugar pyrophosphorylase family protein
MYAGIIAAGLGERMMKGGIEIPKPLIRIGGEPLIGRAICSAVDAGAERVAVVVNDLYPQVAEYIRKKIWPAPLDLVVKTTPSSMESLFALAPLLNEPFLLLTVDLVCPFEIIRDFVRQCSEFPHAHAVLALTDYIDDEKPLRVIVDRDGRIIRLGESVRESRYITAGFYFFSPEIFAFISEARKRKLSALRAFLSLILESGRTLYGLPVGKTMDIDRPSDLRQVEDFLTRETDA